MKVTWKTSNKPIATVSKTEKVTAVKKGDVKITCTIGKRKLVCEITAQSIIKKQDFSFGTMELTLSVPLMQMVR